MISRSPDYGNERDKVDLQGAIVAFMSEVEAFPASLGSGFQDHIERSFCGTANARKSAFRENVSQASLAGLCSKGKADFLTERTRSAYHRRESVIHSADRIDILSE